MVIKQFKPLPPIKLPDKPIIRFIPRGGVSGGLAPITDVLGRPLKGPVGSEVARSQTQEASRIFKEREAEKSRKRQETLRVERVGRQIGSIEQRLKLGRFSERQRNIFEGQVSRLRKSIGVTKPGAVISGVSIPRNIERVLIKKDEIFDPSLGAFVSIAGLSRGGTKITRPPTLAEQVVIDEANRRGSFLAISAKVAEFERGVTEFFQSEEKLKVEFEKAIKEGKTTKFSSPGVKRAIALGFTDFEEAKAAGVLRRDLPAEKESLKRQFPPLRIFEFGAEGALTAGEFVVQKKVPEPTRQIVKDVLEDIFIFGSFSPFIKTAAASRTSTKAKKVQKQTTKQTDKSKINKLRQLRGEIKTSSDTKVKSFIKKEISKIKKGGFTPQQEAERLRNLEIFVREARGQIVIRDGKIVPIVNIDKVAVSSKAIATSTKIDIQFPRVPKLEKLGEILSGTAIQRGITRSGEEAKNKKRIERSKKPLGERFEEAQAGQIGRAFGTASLFAGTGEFERTDVVESRISGQLSQLDSQLKLTSLTNTQSAGLRSRQLSLQTELLISKTDQVVKTNQITNQIDRQLQLNKQRQKSLLRQLNLTKNAQRQNQIARQISQTKQVQKNLTKQMLRFGTLQVSLTKQISKLKSKTGRRFGKPFKKLPIRKIPKIPLITLGKGKKKKVKKAILITTGVGKKKFRVFVRKKGEDILFKEFKTAKKARKGLKKRLSTTLRASGFIVNRRTGKRLIPKISKGFRISKIDPFRIVEKRGRRLDTRSEVKAIKEAKRIKPKKIKSNMKATKLIKFRRKK